MPGNTTTPMVRRTGAAGLGGIDVVFPILHGPFGEDGTVQGLLKLANLPFVGAGVLGSAVGMDKDVMKRLLRDAGVAIGKFMAFERADKISFAKVKRTLGMPLFVKPANLGFIGGHQQSRQAEPVQRRDQRSVSLRQQDRYRRVHRRAARSSVPSSATTIRSPHCPARLSSTANSIPTTPSIATLRVHALKFRQNYRQK